MINGKIVSAVIPARLKSERLKEKPLLKFNGKENIINIIERTARSKYIDKIIIAIADCDGKDILIDIIDENGGWLSSEYNKTIYYMCGPENDIYVRTLDSASIAVTDIIVDFSLDCVLVDHNIIDMLLLQKEFGDYNYLSNVIDRSFPDGFDIQVYDYKLYASIKDAVNLYDYLSCMYTGWNIPLLYHNSKELNDYKIGNYYLGDKKYIKPEWRLVLDEKADYVLLDIIYKHFGGNDFSFFDVMDYLLENEFLMNINKYVKPHVYTL